MMDTYYTLLDIPTHASAEEINAAYQRQCARYNLDRVAELGIDFRNIANARIDDLERAYQVLSNPQRRREYDGSIGIAPTAVVQRASRRTGLSRTEWLMAVGGGFVGLLIIAVVWVVLERNADPALPPAAQADRLATDFALPAMNGQTVKLSDYRGKIVLLNFWYTGCEPCREETPALEVAHRRLAAQGLQIIGVNVRANERSGAVGDEDIRAFMHMYGVTYPIVMDVDSQVDRDYQIYVLPTSIMIDGDGKVRYLLFSTMTTESVEALFNKLQQEMSAKR